MTHHASIALLPSRPKIHRLPALPPQGRKVPVPVAFSLSLFLTMMVIAMMASRLFMGQGSVSDVEETGGQPVIGEAMASSALPSQAGAGTIVIKDKDSSIVGQMAKIPAKSEQITEIKAVSNIDKRAGRDLLSIINNY